MSLQTYTADHWPCRHTTAPSSVCVNADVFWRGKGKTFPFLVGLLSSKHGLRWQRSIVSESTFDAHILLQFGTGDFNFIRFLWFTAFLLIFYINNLHGWEADTISMRVWVGNCFIESTEACETATLHSCLNHGLSLTGLADKQTCPDF